MPMPYTDRIEYMLKLLKDYKLQDDKRGKELQQKLKTLRKYSDVAELIVRPKNPKPPQMGYEINKRTFFEPSDRTEEDLNTEKEQFKAFKEELEKVKSELIEFFRTNRIEIDLEKTFSQDQAGGTSPRPSGKK